MQSWERDKKNHRLLIGPIHPQPRFYSQRSHCYLLSHSVYKSHSVCRQTPDPNKMAKVHQNINSKDHFNYITNILNTLATRCPRQESENVTRALAG